MMYHVELVCEDCSYEVAVGNIGESAFRRLIPRECPECGGDLVSPSNRVEAEAVA